MCETKNDPNAQSCKYCGYLFEDFSNPETKPPSSQSSLVPRKDQEQESSWSTGTTPPSTSDTFSMSPPSPIVTGAPLFVVSRSLLSSIAPAVIYLVFILSIISSSSFNPLSIALIAIFILIAVLPILFTPRRYEFYDASLRIHKIIGGDSEIPYTDIVIHDSSVGRKPRIVLSATGQRRPIVISGNPTNKELGQDLSQFLSTKLKKRDAESTNQQQSSSSEDAGTATDTPDDTSKD